MDAAELEKYEVRLGSWAHMPAVRRLSGWFGLLNNTTDVSRLYS
jgi:hypothetical protein